MSCASHAHLATPGVIAGCCVTRGIGGLKNLVGVRAWHVQEPGHQCQVVSATRGATALPMSCWVSLHCSSPAGCHCTAHLLLGVTALLISCTVSLVSLHCSPPPGCHCIPSVLQGVTELLISSWVSLVSLHCSSPGCHRIPVSCWGLECHVSCTGSHCIPSVQLGAGLSLAGLVLLGHHTLFCSALLGQCLLHTFCWPGGCPTLVLLCQELLCCLCPAGAGLALRALALLGTS